MQAEEEARLNETRTRLDSSTPTARIAFKWMRKAAGHARAMESSRMSPGWSAVSRLVRGDDGTEEQQNERRMERSVAAGG